MDEQHVLVTSDTHVRDGAQLPAALLTLAERADHILHAGDLVAADVLDVLGALAPVSAVAGNCDGHDVRARIPDELVVDVAGVRCALVHDAGAAPGRVARLRARFPEADVIVYGHSHMPEVTVDDDVYIINPGSPVQRRRAPFHSAFWVEVSGGAVRAATLVDLDASS